MDTHSSLTHGPSLGHTQVSLLTHAWSQLVSLLNRSWSHLATVTLSLNLCLTLGIFLLKESSPPMKEYPPPR